MHDNTDQASQAMRSHSTLPITDPQDSIDEEDVENEDFSKLIYIVRIMLWQLIIPFAQALYNAHHTHAPL